MLKQQTHSKSPMTLLLLITCLVIATLVMVSNYFFRPGLESNLKSKVISKLYSHNIFNAVIDVNGRDVTLKGITMNSSEAENIKADIKNITGVNNLKSDLVVDSKLKRIEHIQTD